MNTNKLDRNHFDLLQEALRNGEHDTPSGKAVARLKEPFILGDGKNWHYEGFVGMFTAVRQALASLDDSISPGLPPFLLDPTTIARLFRIPLADFNWQGIQGSDAASDTLIRLDNRTQEVCDRLSSIEGNLTALVQQHTIKEFYTTEDLCKIFDKAPYTVREWCRLGRIKAKKAHASCGGEFEWRVSHEELIRIQNEGLLPIPTKY